MQFEYTEPQTELERLFGGRFHINAIGLIEPGDGEKFREFLRIAKPPPRLTVYIDSIGGDVDAAIEIGREIRSRWFATDIGTYVLDFEEPAEHFVRRRHIAGLCLSAATLIYLGGRLRHFARNSHFGVHQFAPRNPSPENGALSQRLSAKIAKYVEDMGISIEFMEISSAAPSTEILLLSEEQLQNLKVITGGATGVEWTVHARNNQMYVRGERDTIFGHQKVMLCFIRETGFMFWSLIETQGREKELTEFGLVEIVANDERDRIDITERCMRFPMGPYVHVLSKISDDEARTLAYSDGFGVQIRANEGASMFFGISPMPTEGGADALQTFYRTLARNVT